jgi:hypothetical protein
MLTIISSIDLCFSRCNDFCRYYGAFLLWMKLILFGDEGGEVFGARRLER